MRVGREGEVWARWIGAAKKLERGGGGVSFRGRGFFFVVGICGSFAR